MNKFEKELIKGAKENEKIVLLTSLDIINKAHDSSLMAVGLFNFADKESVFLAKQETDLIIGRVNLSIRTIAEIEQYNKFLDYEIEIDTKITMMETICHIQHIIDEGNKYMYSLVKNRISFKDKKLT